jgi:hypothetical protein
MIELEAYAVGLRETLNVLPKLEWEPRFVGAMPPELRPRSKTRLLNA